MLLPNKIILSSTSKGCGSLMTCQGSVSELTLKPLIPHPSLKPYGRKLHWLLRKSRQFEDYGKKLAAIRTQSEFKKASDRITADTLKTEKTLSDTKDALLWCLKDYD